MSISYGIAIPNQQLPKDRRRARPRYTPIPTNWQEAFTLLLKHVSGDIVTRQLANGLYLRNYSSSDDVSLIRIKDGLHKVVVTFNTNGIKE